MATVRKRDPEDDPVCGFAQRRLMPIALVGPAFMVGRLESLHRLSRRRLLMMTPSRSWVIPQKDQKHELGTIVEPPARAIRR